MNTKSWKIAAVLIALVAVIALLIWGPVLSGDPDPGPDVRLPSMENVPPSDERIKIDVQPEGSSSQGAAP